MSEQTNNAKMTHDRIVYMIAKGIEAVVGIVTMSCMTHFLSANQMGQYTIVNTAITLLAMVLVQWLAQAVLRYVNKYRATKDEDTFYSTVAVTWARLNVLAVGIILICILGLSIAGIYLPGAGGKIPKTHIILCGSLWFFTYNATLIITSMLAALREATLNLYLSVISVVGRLVFIVLLTKMLGSSVNVIFISYFLTDSIICLIGFWKLHFLGYLRKNKVSKEILKELKDYGTPLMGNMVTNSVLNKSDTYIITGYIGSAPTGIYQTNYSLVATAFTMLSSSIMRGSYPTILKTWSEGKKELSISLISDSVRTYLLLAIPAVMGIASISDVIATVLFDVEYVQGHFVMFWVALGMLLQGLAEYSIKPWELTSKTKNIFGCSLIGGVVNLLLNIILVPIGGYMVAAWTTCIGFVVYYLAVVIGTRKYDSWKINIRTYINLILSAGGMYIVLVIAKKFVDYNLITMVLLIVLGIVVYGIGLLISGEVKEELAMIMRKLKSMRKGK